MNRYSLYFSRFIIRPVIGIWVSNSFICLTLVDKQQPINNNKKNFVLYVFYVLPSTYPSRDHFSLIDILRLSLNVNLWSLYLRRCYLTCKIEPVLLVGLWSDTLGSGHVKTRRHRCKVIKCLNFHSREHIEFDITRLSNPNELSLWPLPLSSPSDMFCSSFWHEESPKIFDKLIKTYSFQFCCYRDKRIFIYLFQICKSPDQLQIFFNQKKMKREIFEMKFSFIIAVALAHFKCCINILITPFYRKRRKRNVKN